MDGGSFMTEGPPHALPKLTFDDFKEILNRVKGEKQKKGKNRKLPFIKPDQRSLSDLNGQSRDEPPSSSLEAALLNATHTETSVRESAVALAGANTSGRVDAALARMQRPNNAHKPRVHWDPELVREKDLSLKPPETFQFSKAGTSVQARHTVRVDKTGHGKIGLKSCNIEPKTNRRFQSSSERNRKETMEVPHQLLSLTSIFPNSEDIQCDDTKKATPADGRESQTDMSWARSLLGFPEKNRPRARPHPLERLLRKPPTETERLATELRQMADDEANPRALRLFFDSIIEKYVDRPARERGHPRLNSTTRQATHAHFKTSPRRDPLVWRDRSAAAKDSVSYGRLLRNVTKPVPPCLSLSELLRGQGAGRLGRVATAVRRREMQIINEARISAAPDAQVLPQRRLSKVTTEGAQKTPTKVKEVLKLPKIAPPARIPNNAFFLPKSEFPFYNLPWQR